MCRTCHFILQGFIINSNDLVISGDISKIQFDRAHRGIVWVNNDRKFSFLGIPKAGNSGIRKHLNMNQIVSFHAKPDYWKFTVIREPVERFVSAYIEVMEECSQYPICGRFQYDLELPKMRILLLREICRYGVIEKFEAYLKKITEWGFFEFHCVPQAIYLTDENNELFPDVEIYKLTDLKPLERKLETKFERGNLSERPDLKKKLLSHIWNREKLRLRIEDLYRHDMAIWQSF